MLNFLKEIRDIIAEKLAIRNLRNDPQVKEDIEQLNEEIEDLWDDINEVEAEFDPKAKPYKPKKVTFDDLIKKKK